MTTLYKQHSTGKVGTWTITVEGNAIHMDTQTKPGAKIARRTEIVHEGKAGRTLDQQIESRVKSRIASKLDNGYKHTRELASADAHTSTLGLPQPMLAQADIRKLADADTIWVQPKLDGMRMIVTRQNGKTFAYSRGGKPITTVQHILDQADHILQDGEFLDGELYVHGESLQTIMSWAKRQQPDSESLVFNMFDVIDDIPFIQRFSGIQSRIIEAGLEHVRTVYTDELTDDCSLPQYMRQARRMGFEGLILRDDSTPYQAGKRSKGLIKVKQFLDAEFLVLEVTTGAQGMPVLICETEEHHTFRVTAPGNHAEKQWALENPEFFVGHYVTVKYAGRTPYGIPFHPVCLGRRE
jgi:DNA ligase-1